MCIYAAGVILSYVTFREAFRDWKLGIFSTMLYCWAPWYIDTLYGRAAIGEASGYAFLPVLLLFLVRAVGQREGKLPQWVLLTLGTTLLLQSSFAVFIVGMLMLLFCCIYYRRQMLGRAGLFRCGMLGILLSLGSFPWELLRRNVVFQVLTFSMQSPVIFMIPAVCGLVLAGCGVLEYYRRERSFAEATILEIAVAAVAFVSTQFLTNKLLLTREPLWIRQKEDLPELVLVEAPQLQMSAAGGSLQWGTVAIGILGIVGIVIYCIFRQRKDRKQEVRKEAA